MTGAVNHGYGVYGYIDFLTWPHDADLMINVLVDVLLKREALAPVLYLQLDNTARENKNQYVMAFLAYLVQAGIFSEVSIAQINIIKSMNSILLYFQIYLSFLMVGHTHEDIDQVFSRVFSYLKKNSAYTVGGR